MTSWQWWPLTYNEYDVWSWFWWVKDIIFLYEPWGLCHVWVTVYGELGLDWWQPVISTVRSRAWTRTTVCEKETDYIYCFYMTSDALLIHTFNWNPQKSMYVVRCSFIEISGSFSNTWTMFNLSKFLFNALSFSFPKLSFRFTSWIMVP